MARPPAKWMSSGVCDEGTASVFSLAPVLMAGLVVGGLFAFSRCYRRAGSVVVTVFAALLGATFLLAFVL